jgi:glutathione synthase/RimK-type ligase-like ATP-grasp enzyme
VAAGRAVGIACSIITAEDAARVAEFDALFIRETTLVNHHTYRIARRAVAAGLVVIDHPDDILRCTNKVYQAEIFMRHEIPCPRTLVVHAGNVDQVAASVGLPCVLKRPDSSFSRGVVKATTAEELQAHLAAFLHESDLVIAQEFIPSAFDWRIGVLEGRALYACRYHMASGHWQIIGSGKHGRPEYGTVEGVEMSRVPERARRLAERAAQLIGDGLYGVDIKEIGHRFLLMEINDNPTLETGNEDAVLGNELYLAVMRCFRSRLDARGLARNAP